MSAVGARRCHCCKVTFRNLLKIMVTERVPEDWRKAKITLSLLSSRKSGKKTQGQADSPQSLGK